MEKTFDTNRKFADLGIIPPILKALEEMGFEYPTEIQSRAIPHALAGKDIIAMAKTGSGKTAVFGVSMLQLTDPEAEGPQGLILTPTRELAVQVDSDIRRMAKFLAHRTTVVYGQHSMEAEVKELEKGATIVTGTPGRVYDHIQQGTLRTRNIKFLVLDEADRMLDMGFIDQVERIIRSVPRDRVTALFSATIPDEVKRICSRYMKDPETIETESQTKTVDTIRQLYYHVDGNEKLEQLNKVLLVERPESCMIFCNTRIATDKVGRYLSKKGYACRVLHGDIPQSRRIKTIQQFKQGKFRLLVATDVAARGIHIDELSLVINYDVPLDKDSYVHRIGRTGRAGHEGRAVSIVTRDDLMDLYAIEEHIGVLIEECELPGDEFLSEHKQEIDEWIAANTIKKTDSRKTGEKSETGSQGRRDRNRPDRRKKPDTRPGTQRNAPEGTAVKDDAGRQYKNTGKQTREDNGKQRQNSGKQKPHSKTEKPLRQETKPGGQDTGPMRQDAKPLRRSAGNQPVRGLPEAASPQKPDGNIRTPGGETRKSGGKPGFIRRILGRILGR